MGRNKMARLTGWRAVKTNHNYTVEEAARNQGKSKGTVRRWLKTGLPSLNDRRPCLILGGDMIDFLKNRKAPKQKCKPEECFCFKCRAPRQAALGEADYKPITATYGMLTALCVECTTTMCKRVTLVTLKALKGTLQISIRQANDRISKG
jgi:hypothetical protein